MGIYEGKDLREIMNKMNKWKQDNQKYNNYLTCVSVKFYSNQDEDAFFSWIEKINCISSISAAKNELYLDLIDGDLSFEDIHELIGLFARYKIDMKQLAGYKTEKNYEAFLPWQKEIFETEK